MGCCKKKEQQPLLDNRATDPLQLLAALEQPGCAPFKPDDNYYKPLLPCVGLFDHVYILGGCYMVYTMGWLGLLLLSPMKVWQHLCYCETNMAFKGVISLMLGSLTLLSVILWRDSGSRLLLRFLTIAFHVMIPFDAWMLIGYPFAMGFVSGNIHDLHGLDWMMPKMYVTMLALDTAMAWTTFKLNQYLAHLTAAKQLDDINLALKIALNPLSPPPPPGAVINGPFPPGPDPHMYGHGPPPAGYAVQQQQPSDAHHHGMHYHGPDAQQYGPVPPGLSGPAGPDAHQYGHGGPPQYPYGLPPASSDPQAQHHGLPAPEAKQFGGPFTVGGSEPCPQYGPPPPAGPDHQQGAMGPPEPQYGPPPAAPSDSQQQQYAGPFTVGTTDPQQCGPPGPGPQQQWWTSTPLPGHAAQQFGLPPQQCGPGGQYPGPMPPPGYAAQYGPPPPGQGPDGQPQYQPGHTHGRAQ